PLATPTRTSFRLTGADGGPLQGDVRTAGAGRPAVVICHGLNASKDWGFFPHVAERLARAGFTAVSFTFPGPPNVRDLDFVLQALGSGELGAVPKASGLLGHSIGGAIAVQRAATDTQIGALVTWGTVASPDVLL